MDRRKVILLLVVVLILAIPAFCLGGILDHACGCSQGWCSHDGCANDPCDTLVRGDESDGFGVDLPAPALVAVLGRVDLDLVPDEPWRRGLEGQPPRRALAYHATDLPLRI